MLTRISKEDVDLLCKANYDCMLETRVETSNMHMPDYRDCNCYRC